MPQPMDTAPPASQMCAEGLCTLLATREESFSAVCETKIATATERTTSQELYVPATGVMLHQMADPGR
jgi:hypothetical protein